MKWLPYHRFSFTSRLRLAEALQAMAAHVESENWFRISRPADDRRFEGRIDAGGFHVRRIIGYRNSFLPVVIATVEDTGLGAEVRVTMRPFVFVIVFMAVWFSAAASPLFSQGGGMVWFSAIFFIFGYALVMLPFWYEATKQERVLREIMQARPDQPELVT